jgi:hypothetical protein
MYATIETLASVVRVHEDGQEGDERTYTWSCFAVFNLHCGTATLYGAIRAPTPQEARALKRALQSIGITEVEWERRTGSNPGEHKMRI